MGKSISQHYGMLCCDTTLLFTFENISCKDPEVRVSCDDIKDTLINLTMTTMGDCVGWQSAFADLQGNSVLVSCESAINFSWDNAVFNKSKKIWIENINPMPANNSVSIPAGGLFELYFNVNSNELGDIDPVTFDIITKCINDDGTISSVSGRIQIKVKASICDLNECICPFGENEKVKEFALSQPVIVGSSETSSFTLLKANSSILGEDCLLLIDDISRKNGSDPFAVGSGDWYLNTMTFPVELKLNDELIINANFSPRKAGSIYDTLTVNASIYSLADLTTPKGQCSFDVALLGKGCISQCPSLVISSYNPAVLTLADNSKKTLNFGSNVSMSEGSLLEQNMNVITLSNCSFDNYLSDGKVKYILQTSSNANLCSAYSITSCSKTGNDAPYFEIFKSPSYLEITFNRDQLSGTNNNQTYSANFVIVASDAYGNSCSQDLRVNVSVTNVPYYRNNVYAMFAFGQESNYFQKSLSVFKIDHYNPDLNQDNFGKISNLNENSNYGLINGIYFHPITDHSLYFEIDQPTVYIPQTPELYLVNSTGNQFTHISKISGLSFASTEAFTEAYRNTNMVDQIFSNVKNIDGKSYWTPYFEAEDTDGNTTNDLIFPNGMQLTEGSVYIIWNPGSDQDVNNALFCDVALMYIEKIHTGATSGNNDRSIVSFYIQYPVSSY